MSESNKRTLHDPQRVQCSCLRFRHAQAIAEYVEHYHRERNHQGLENRLISRQPVIAMTGRVRRRPRLGGLLNFYQRAA